MIVANPHLSADEAAHAGEPAKDQTAIRTMDIIATALLERLLGIFS
jgi:hypothetical protein